MPVLEYLEIGGKMIPISEQGYLERFNDWDETVAGELARREGVGVLTDDKLAALRFIRQHYQKFNYFPIVTSVCKQIHRAKECVQEDFINPLLAWKIAGLPEPGEPVISLLKAGQSPG
jgi:TusE/DsrC/DsvC family sulfur relay protein